MGNIIDLKNVDKIYTGYVDTQVLFDINLSFEDGSCNSIVGESGSGKSTLLNIISTLDKPTRGEVFIGGVRTSNMSKKLVIAGNPDWKRGVFMIVADTGQRYFWALWRNKQTILKDSDIYARRDEYKRSSMFNMSVWPHSKV